MASRTSRERAEDIQNAIVLIRRYVLRLQNTPNGASAAVAAAVAAQNQVFMDAIYRQFEIMGEAAGQLSAQSAAVIATIDPTGETLNSLRLAKATRNFLSHKYWLVSPAIILATVDKEFDKLGDQMNAILPHL